MAIHPDVVITVVQPTHGSQQGYISPPNLLPVRLNPGETLRPGQQVKRVCDKVTGESYLARADGLGDVVGYVDMDSVIRPYTTRESVGIPRSMIRYPDMFHRDCIIGALYRRDLLEALGDTVTYERSWNSITGEWQMTL